MPMKSSASPNNCTPKADVSYGHILKYTGLFGGVQGLTMFISLVRNKLTAVLLGADGVGLISIFNNIATFVSNASNLGIPFNIVRNTAELYENGSDEALRKHIKIVRTWSVWTGLFGAFLCIILAPLIACLAFENPNNGQYSICLLAPMIFALAISGGELAILKGVRQLKKVAVITTIGGFSTLLCTIPFFYFWLEKGIVPALVVSTIALTILYLYFSTKLFRWETALFSQEIFHKGIGMMKIGVPFMLAAIANALAALAIPLFLLRYGTLEEVGYYRVGYGLMVTYAGTVFVAIEADFFPRLSAAHKETESMNKIINQQIEICLLLIAPILVLFILAMPFIISLLYSKAFSPAIDMAACAVFYMFFRAITLPTAYTPLAKGDTTLYLGMEVLYDVVMLLLITLFFYHWGVTGTGIGLSLSALFDMLLVTGVYGKKYHIRLHSSVKSAFFCQFICLFSALVVALQPNLLLKYTIGPLLLLLSTYHSLSRLSQRTDWFYKIRNKLSQK